MFESNFPCRCITLRAGLTEFRLHDFFFGIPLLFLDLTLPPASPPINPGPQRHSPLAFSRSRATPGAESHRGSVPPPHRRPQSWNSNPTSGHLDSTLYRKSSTLSSTLTLPVWFAIGTSIADFHLGFPLGISTWDFHLGFPFGSIASRQLQAKAKSQVQKKNNNMLMRTQQIISI